MGHAERKEIQKIRVLCPVTRTLSSLNANLPWVSQDSSKFLPRRLTPPAPNELSARAHKEERPRLDITNPRAGTLENGPLARLAELHLALEAGVLAGRDCRGGVHPRVLDLQPGRAAAARRRGQRALVAARRSRQTGRQSAQKRDDLRPGRFGWLDEARMPDAKGLAGVFFFREE